MGFSKNMNIDKVGFIDKGTGEHQSNVVYGLCESSVSPTLTASLHKSPPHDLDKYMLCKPYAYCIDANYYKGTTFEQYLQKKRRQLIIEVSNNTK